MKILLVYVLFSIISLGVPLSGNVKAQDPITLIIAEGIKKVIQAVDLKIQRLQNETIWLQNAQKSIENTMSKVRLDEITDWVEKHKLLYQDYYEELWKIKATIAFYHRIRDIMDKQSAIVKEYKRAYDLFKRDKNFTADELMYMGKVYSGILDESLKNIDDIFIVLNAFSTQMSDAKRLDIINAAAISMDRIYNDLKSFNNQSIQLSLQRTKSAADAAVVKKLYGL